MFILSNKVDFKVDHPTYNSIQEAPGLLLSVCEERAGRAMWSLEKAEEFGKLV